VRSCAPEAEVLAEFKVYMRYTGQGWEIPIILTEEQAMAPQAEAFVDLFQQDYARLFGRPVVGLDVEITVWAVNATTPPQPVCRIEQTVSQGTAPAIGKRQMFDPGPGRFVSAIVVDRADIAVGQTVSGPAAIVEDETTIILPTGALAICQPDGCIDIAIGGAKQ